MAQQEFEWDGNHPILNFVNTLDERFTDVPFERIPDYPSLLNFLEQAEIIDHDTKQALTRIVEASNGSNVLATIMSFREDLFVLLQSLVGNVPRDPEVLRRIEVAIQDALQARTFVLNGPTFQWEWLEPHALLRPLWELATLTGELLVSGDVRRIKKCHSDTCGVFFLDKSRAGTRRWCSMSNCGNRNKVNRFRSTKSSE
jgi:predicted RNA-binding Zn ribbon-like protein